MVLMPPVLQRFPYLLKWAPREWNTPEALERQLASLRIGREEAARATSIGGNNNKKKSQQ